MSRLRCMLALCALTSVACGGDFPPGSRLQKLRILALHADAPFAQPGERVLLQPLVFDPDGRELQWAMATCTDPRGSSVDACLSELDGPFEPLPEPMSAEGIAVTVPDDALTRLPEGERDGALLGVALVACPGAIERGTTHGVPVVCRDEAGDALALDAFEVAVKRLFVREADRNRNPRIEQLTWDGEPWPEDEVKSARACDAPGDDIEECPAELRHRVQVLLDPPESGVDEHGSRFGEQLIVHAFGGAGVFEDAVRIGPEADHTFAAQRPANGDETELFFVARDDRGGVAWARRTVRVR